MDTYKLLFLSQEDIIGLDLSYEVVIDAVKKVMSAHAKGLCQLPSKIHVNPLEGTYLNAMLGSPRKHRIRSPRPR